CAIAPDMRTVIDALAADANVHWHDPDHEEYAGFDDFDGFDEYGDSSED
ncbi:MAG: hypothetical protein H6961_07645, partial [Chromatiaceae bacterium]|nr:hypothetical protein [Chromatiaceae bacterium]